MPLFKGGRHIYEAVLYEKGGGVCASDKRYEGAVVVPLSSCQKNILGHTRSVGVSDISSEVELILARASIFSPPRDISSWTICPSHRSSLGIGWRRGAHRSRVPPGLSKHASRGKTRKADRGISKSESKAILKQTGVFVPVGSGKYTFRAYFSVFLLARGCNQCTRP